MRKIIALVLLVLSQISFAQHNCAGVVNKVDISSAGNVHVNIQGIGDGNILCSLEEAKGLYKPESCKAVLSLALSAKLSAKPLRVYFRNDTETSCAKGSWKDFSGPAYQLYYVSIEG